MKKFSELFLSVFIVVFLNIHAVQCLNKSEEFEIVSELFNNGLIKELGKHVKNYEDRDITQCIKDIQIWSRDLLQGRLWALQMIDSNGKFPPGIMTLNIHSYGQFDECLSVKHENIKGKYCMAKIPLERFIEKLPFNRIPTQADDFNPRFIAFDDFGRRTFSLGICLPHSCNTDEIMNMINIISEGFGITESLLTIPEKECTTTEPVEWDPEDWGALGFFTFFGVLIVASTIFDLVTRHNNDKSKTRELLKAFSIWTNTSNLMRINRSKKNIRCLHGIRSLSILWIVLAHRFSYELYIPLMNVTDFFHFSKNPGSWILIGASFAVDTFFVLSGLLVAYLTFKQFQRKECFNFPMMYLHRYLRLTPALGAAAFFQATLFQYIGNGPVWKTFAEYDVTPCKEYWWTTILYVQNYVNPGSLCVFQSWYLSCDMQFFILSPIVIYPLLKWRRIGVSNLVFWILIAQIGTFIIAYVNEWTAAHWSLTGQEHKGERFGLATHAKGTPWLLGFAAGYLLHLCTDKKIKLNKILVAIGWIISLAIMASVIFGMKTFQNFDHQITHAEDTLYNAFSKTAWSLALVWIIIACSLGYGGPINWFLSWEIWEIVGKFSYSIYLVHMMIQYMQLSQIRSPVYFSQFPAVMSFFGDIVLSFLIGYLLMISFELPFVIIEKNIFPKGKSSKLKNNMIMETKKKTDLEIGENEIVAENNDEIDSKLERNISPDENIEGCIDIEPENNINEKMENKTDVQIENETDAKFERSINAVLNEMEKEMDDKIDDQMDLERSIDIDPNEETKNNEEVKTDENINVEEEKNTGVDTENSVNVENTEEEIVEKTDEKIVEKTDQEIVEKTDQEIVEKTDEEIVEKTNVGNEIQSDVTESKTNETG